MKVLLSLAAAALLAPLQEKENPGFKYWADWKVGAWATHKATAGGGIVVESTVTLTEITADKAVVTSAGKVTVNGKDKATAPRKQEILRHDPKMGAIDKEGDEAVEAGGKTYQCHWVQTSTDSAAGKVIMKLWFSKDVPGGIVRSEVGDPAEPETQIKTLLLGFGATAK
jgi:hypothetical protein